MKAGSTGYQLDPHELPPGSPDHPAPAAPVDKICCLSQQFFAVKAHDSIYTWDRDSGHWYLAKQFDTPDFSIQVLGNNQLCAFWLRPCSSIWDRFQVLVPNLEQLGKGVVVGEERKVPANLSAFALLSAQRAVCVQDHQFQIWDPSVPYCPDAVENIVIHDSGGFIDQPIHLQPIRSTSFCVWHEDKGHLYAELVSNKQRHVEATGQWEWGWVLEPMDACCKASTLLSVVDWRYADEGPGLHLILHCDNGLHHFDINSEYGCYSVDARHFYRSAATACEILGDYCLSTGPGGLQLYEVEWARHDTPLDWPPPGGLTECLTIPDSQVGCLAHQQTLLAAAETPSPLQLWSFYKPRPPRVEQPQPQPSPQPASSGGTSGSNSTRRRRGGLSTRRIRRSMVSRRGRTSLLAEAKRLAAQQTDQLKQDDK